jgi:hypothetical protein
MFGNLWSRTARSRRFRQLCVVDMSVTMLLPRASNLKKRSDGWTAAVSHVKDVAPENGSTTSRDAERNDVEDA